MKLKSALPTGLKNQQCERFDPSRVGGLPPVRFVPSSLNEKGESEEKEKEQMVKISVSDAVSKYFKVFKEGDTEDVVNLIQRHESILSDKKLRAKYSRYAALMSDKKIAWDTLNGKPRKTPEDKEELAALKTAIKEYRVQSSAVQDEAFDYFEKLLDQTLVPVWRDIVVEQCDTDGYVDLNGKKQTGKRGRSFGSLQACYLQVVLSVSTQDAAERHKRYVSTTVKKADNVTIVQLFARLIQLNDMTKYLPCLKHVEDSPDDLPKMNVPFTELEMCTNVIASLPLSISTGYYAQKGMHFPTKLTQLKEDLIRVTASVQRHDKMIADLRAKAGIPTKGSGQEKAKMSGPNKPIPKKARFGKAKESGGPSNGGPPSNDHTNKLCQLCAKHSPGCKNSHNTAQCRKWNADGTDKCRAGELGKLRNTNAHSHPEEDMKAVFAQMRKEIKALKKLTKKSCKKRSRKRYYDSSDDSDSSDDE